MCWIKCDFMSEHGEIDGKQWTATKTFIELYVVMLYDGSFKSSLFDFKYPTAVMKDQHKLPKNRVM